MLGTLITIYRERPVSVEVCPTRERELEHGARRAPGRGCEELVRLLISATYVAPTWNVAADDGSPRDEEGDESATVESGTRTGPPRASPGLMVAGGARRRVEVQVVWITVGRGCHGDVEHLRVLMICGSARTRRARPTSGRDARSRGAKQTPRRESAMTTPRQTEPLVRQVQHDETSSAVMATPRSGIPNSS